MPAFKDIAIVRALASRSAHLSVATVNGAVLARHPARRATGWALAARALTGTALSAGWTTGLLAFGATFERRRRDLRQLRESVAAMR